MAVEKSSSNRELRSTRISVSQRAPSENTENSVENGEKTSKDKMTLLEFDRNSAVYPLSPSSADSAGSASSWNRYNDYDRNAVAQQPPQYSSREEEGAKRINYQSQQPTVILHEPLESSVKVEDEPPQKKQRASGTTTSG